MGWGVFGDVVDAVSDAGSAVGGAVSDAVSDVADTFYDAATDVADTVHESAGDAFEWGSSAVTSLGGNAWEGALATIGAIEDISPDIPWVDVEISDGQLGVSVDIEGYGAGLSVGEHGVEGHVEAGLLGGNLGISDDGFEVGLQIGDTDWPQWMPALDVGVSGDWEGNIEGDFAAQGTLPFPVGNGVVFGEVGGSFDRNEDGTYSVAGHGEGTFVGADGTRAGGSVYGSYTRTEDGSATTAGASGYYARDDLYVGGNVDYVRLQEGDDVITSLDADGVFRGYGFEAEGGVDYQHAEIDGNEATYFGAHGEVSGRGIEAEGEVDYRHTEIGGEETTHYGARGEVSGHGLEASGSAAYDEFSNEQGTVSQWETDYSIDGVEELVGAEDLAASAAGRSELGLDGPDEGGDAAEFTTQPEGEASDPVDLGVELEPDPAVEVFEPEPAPDFEPEPVLEPEPAPAPDPEPVAAPEPVPAPEPSPLDELNEL